MMTTDVMNTSSEPPNDVLTRRVLVMMTLSKPSEVLTTIFTIAMVAAGLLGLFGNGIVVWTILKPSNKDKLRNIPNGLIAYLSIVDMLCSGIAIPGILLRTHVLVRDRLVCFGLLWSTFASDKMGTWGYLLISFERFFLIMFPFKYAQIVSGRRVVALVTSMAVLLAGLGFTMALLPITSNWDERFGCLLNKLVPSSLNMNAQVLVLLVLETVVMVITYGCLMYVAQKHRRQISAAQQMAAPSIDQSQEVKGDNINRKRTAWLFRKTDLRAAMRCFVIVAVHLVCHWPLALFATLNIHGITQREPNLQLVFLLLKFSCSAINPYLYAKTNSHLRRSILMQLKCDFGDDIAGGSSSTSRDPQAHNRGK